MMDGVRQKLSWREKKGKKALTLIIWLFASVAQLYLTTHTHHWEYHLAPLAVP